MNPIDRVIAFFAPRSGEARIRARVRMAHLMNYDGASRGRRTAGWKAPGTNADAAALGSRERLRNVSRDLIRNRPYAARACAVVAANVVGTGVTPSVQGTESVRKAVQSVIDGYLMTPQIDAYGEARLNDLQSIVMRAVFSDGEVLVRRRMRNTRFHPDLLLPFQVEIVEADQLDTTITNYGVNEVIEGVEYGPTGAVEAYHLLADHPGSAKRNVKRLTTRVGWRDIIHVRRFDRPGQTRGVPWLAPVMLTLVDIGDYQEAEILKQKMSALLAGVVTGVNPKEGQKGLEDLSPGALVFAGEDGDVKFTTPPKVDGYDDFMRRNLSTVAVGIGITYEALTGDLKGVNFSSGRMGRMEMDRMIKVWQENLIIGQFCKGIERWVREAMSLTDTFRGVKEFTIDWTAPRRILVDPTKEVPAMIEEMDAGVTSRQRVQRELGYDPETVRRERMEDATAEAAMPRRDPKPTKPKKTNGDDDANGE